jgi:hypothetical protein
MKVTRTEIHTLEILYVEFHQNLSRAVIPLSKEWLQMI